MKTLFLADDTVYVKKDLTNGLPFCIVSNDNRIGGKNGVER